MREFMHSLSASPQVLADAKPGMVVNGTISRLVPAGVIVKLTSTISGLIPNAHLADTPVVKHPEKRFIIGRKLKVRILKVRAFASEPQTDVIYLLSHFFLYASLSLAIVRG